MNHFTLIAWCYFLFELIVNGIVPAFQSEQEQFDPYTGVIQQFYDLTIIGSLLIIFRPREWPEYFSVGLLDGGQGFNNDNENGLEVEERRIAPLLQTKITEKLLNSIRSGGSNDM